MIRGLISAGGGGALEYQETITTTGGSSVTIDLTNAKSARIGVKQISSSGNIRPGFAMSPDGGSTQRTSTEGFLLTDTSSSFTSGTTAPIGSTSSAANHWAIIDLQDISSARATKYQMTVASTSAGVALRHGWFTTAEAQDSAVLTLSSGTFDEMDVEVFASY